MTSLRMILLGAACLGLWAADAAAQCPSSEVSDVLHDDRVKQAMADLWRDSHEGQPDEHEEGAWVYQCQSTNVLTGATHYYTDVRRWPSGDLGGVPSGPVRQDHTCRLVASIHTHPGPSGQENNHDGFENEMESSQDRRFSAQHGVPGIIIWGNAPNPRSFSYGYNGMTAPRDPTWECPSVPVWPGSGHGASTGDTHVRTLDGTTYDFQAIGDFLLVASLRGDLELQVRQEPYRRLVSGAVNTLLVVRDGADRIEWSLAPADPLVNGVGRPIALGAALTLRGHGLLRHTDEGYEFVSSVGDRLTVVPADESLDFFLRLASHRRGQVRGMLGNFDGDPDNDVQTAQGKVVSILSSANEDASAPLYAVFGNSWRVAADRSLLSHPFVARPGVNPASFPQKQPEFTEAQIEAAERICKAKGVADPRILENCVFDTIATGSATFAASAARAEKAEPPLPAVTTGAAAHLDQEMIGAIDRARGQVSYALTLAAGTYVFDARGSRGTSWAVRAPNESHVLDANQGSFMGEYPARITITMAGVYTVDVSLRDKMDRGRYRFRVRTVPVHAPTPLALNTEVEGRIASVGEEFTYQLRLRAGRYDFHVLTSDNAAWGLISPGGDQLFDANQQSFMEDVPGLNIPKDGTYVLETRGRGVVGLGSYRVTITARPR